jgi:hypothetical protein
MDSLLGKMARRVDRKIWNGRKRSIVHKKMNWLSKISSQTHVHQRRLLRQNLEIRRMLHRESRAPHSSMNPHRRTRHGFEIDLSIIYYTLSFIWCTEERIYRYTHKMSAAAPIPIPIISPLAKQSARNSELYIDCTCAIPLTSASWFYCPHEMSSLE